MHTTRRPAQSVSFGIAVTLMVASAPAWSEDVRIINSSPVPVKIDEGELRSVREVSAVEKVRKVESVDKVSELETSATRPLWVKSADRESADPFQWSGEGRFAEGQGEGHFDLRLAGRRFHIEAVSVYVRLPKGQFVPALLVTTTAGREQAPHYIPVPKVGSAGGLEQFTAHQVTHLRADARSVVELRLQRSATEGEGRFWITVSGQLE